MRRPSSLWVSPVLLRVCSVVLALAALIAIGYVTPDADLPAGVHAVVVTR